MEPEVSAGCPREAPGTPEACCTAPRMFIPVYAGRAYFACSAST